MAIERVSSVSTPTKRSPETSTKRVLQPDIRDGVIPPPTATGQPTAAKIASLVRGSQIRGIRSIRAGRATPSSSQKETSPLPPPS